MKSNRKAVIVELLLALFVSGTLCHARTPLPKLVDLTKDGNAAKYVKEQGVLLHTYNLGPTGMRGWIHESWGATDRATQILVTRVEENSPAHGKMELADVILGVADKRFTGNARMTYALAIGEAESKNQKGVMPLLVWRAGKEFTVDLQLKVMGTYSHTAPYDCAKSARILEDGCQYIVRKNNWGRFALEGMALLASGKKEYVEIVRKKAAKMASSQGTADFIKKVAESDEPFGKAWNGGYGALFWTDYCLSTGDKQMLPWVEANAINVARGQGIWGTYGHGFSARKPNGELHGMIPPYGALNQSGLGCFLTMVMARKAGARHKELDDAIARANKFFQYYTGKGTIPYGEHRPEVWAAHDNNGTSGLAAHAFAAQGDHRKEAQFWARMSAAGYKGLEHGHTGPFFSFMWGTPGAAIAGPKAAAAYFKEIAWHYDLERRHDGSFAYTPAGGTAVQWGMDNRGISGTGAYLLTFALPARQLTITGRDPDKKIWLGDKEIEQTIQAGRFSHEKKSIEELLDSLGSWSPAERLTSAQELTRREVDALALVTKLAESDDSRTLVGVCHVLAQLKERAVPALPLLIRLLGHDDPWVCVQAAETLKALGESARPAVPAMLKSIAVTDESDPLRFGQGSLCYALFYPGGNVAGRPGLLAKSIEGIDRELLYPAIRAVAIHPDGHARGCLRSTYTHLTMEDIKVLMPEIVTSIKDMAVCNTMFSKGVMLAGVRMLADHRVEEGIPLGMGMLEMWRFHGRGHVEQYVCGELKKYGASAKPILPRLKAELKRRRTSDPIVDAIKTIENDSNPPQLISLNKYMGKHKDQYKLGK
jgi:hypothetical protein